jgi:hypothetical protein
MLRFAITCSLLTISLVGQTEGELVAKALGAEPFEALRAIGAAKGDAALALGAQLREKLGEDSVLRYRLLRLGLGSDDERVVFGAAVLNFGNDIPVPELRHAAAVIVPRFGDADCPVDFGQLLALWGSRDVPAAIARIPSLPAEMGVKWLQELHRLVRPEHVPAMCALALRTTGDVQRVAWEDARFPVDYSGEPAALVVDTFLQLVGAKPDAAGEGLPGNLTATLRVLLDHDAHGTTPAVAGPWNLCARWLLASRAGPKDLPLLQRILVGPSPLLWLEVAALHALGTLRDPVSAAMLRKHAAGQDEDLRRGALAGLAMRGDAEALATLFAGDQESLGCALTVASPTERRTFWERLLRGPVEPAIQRVQTIGELGKELWPLTGPRFDDSWFAGVEDLVEILDLDARLLRALIAWVPPCATRRLADRLLAQPAATVFAQSIDSVTGDAFADPDEFRADAGYAGVWPFLEVTAPAMFRTRLREGLAQPDPAIRGRCGALLLQLGDQESAAALLEWVKSEPPQLDDLYPCDVLLARCHGPEIQAHFEAQLRCEDGSDRWDEDAAQALAVGLGMPSEVATAWRCDEEHYVEVLAALRAGDAGAAWLASKPECERAGEIKSLAAWADPRIQAFAKQGLDRARAKARTIGLFDLVVGIGLRDPSAINTMRELIHDGRYVTHAAFGGQELTLGRDLVTLPFWIDEYGTNCCRRCVADEAVQSLLRVEPVNDNCNEPPSVRLRRRLLPVQDRLRWSTLANAYVVAGN